ncbi:MAG: TolC family protein [Magnetococcus sp. XQGC-1]
MNRANSPRVIRRNSRFSVLLRLLAPYSVAVAPVLLVACSYGLNPLSSGERAEMLSQDRTALFTRQEPVTRPISLFEAMARALKYNLTHRVALLEKAVAQRQLDLTQFELLPQVAGNAELKARSTPEASKGYSITDRAASNSFSTAQDRSKMTGRLGMAWNILDFGVSAIQASQDADRTLIANENQRKAVHTLLQEVRSTFWRAAGAQKLEDAIGPVIQQARNALNDARQVERERLKPQLEILRFQKTLLEIVRQLQELRHQLSLAKTEFAALINLPPGSEFQLEIPDDPALTIPEIRMTVEEMESLALDNRPDVRESLYTARISRGDVRKAMLRMLPGLEFQVGHNWDSNSFAMSSQWEEASSRVVLNIMNILQGPTAIRLAENREELANMRRLTLHMAILTQVHLAYRQHLSDQRKLQAVEEIDAVDQRIFKNYSATAHNDAQSRLEYISSAASAIMSRLQLYQAYADAQNSVGRIFVTLGVDLAPKATRADEIGVLTDAVRESVMEWDEGVSGTPLQSLLESLSKPARKETEKKESREVAQEKEGSTGIPNYFLEPHFMKEMKEGAPPPVDPGRGLPEKGEADRAKDAQAPQRIFGAESGGMTAEELQRALIGEEKRDLPPPAEKRAVTPQPLPAPVQEKPSAASPPPQGVKQEKGVAAAPREESPTVVKLPPLPADKPPPVKPPVAQAGAVAAAKAAPVQAEKAAVVPTEATSGGKEPEAKGPEESKTRIEVREMLQGWSRAWSQRNPDAYWSYYAGEKFLPAHGQSLAAWRQRSKETLRGLSFLQVEVENLEVMENLPAPMAGMLKKGPIEFVQVAFRESYRSNHLQNFSRKLMILGKEADGWKIFREAVSVVPAPGGAVPPGYGVQVAAAEMHADHKKLLDEWSARGFRPQAVATVDEKKQSHYSIRLAHFREREQAVFFRWFLQIALGVESMVVPAGAAELEGVPAVAPPKAAPVAGKTEEKKGAATPVANKEKGNVPNTKASSGEPGEPEGDR